MEKIIWGVFAMMVLVRREGGQVFPLIRVSVFVIPRPDQRLPLLVIWLRPKQRRPMQIAMAIV